jgi:hypothetical protein
MRVAKSFTIDPDVNEYVDTTKGDHSASDRVNELLKRAIAQERYQRLEGEAEQFFAAEDPGRAETQAVQKAALKTFDRD